MTPSVLWAEHTAPELRTAAADGAVAILPVAAMEQHGPHLPTMVDFRLCTEVAKRGAELAAARGTQALVLPPVWSGMSDHHIPFGGTASLSFDAFRAVILGIARSIHASGFSRLFVLNGHGGNVSALPIILQEAAAISGLRAAGGTYWFLAETEIRAVLEDQPGVRHACEAETSMMMVLEPDLIRRENLSKAFGGEEPKASAGVPDPVFVWRDFAERTTTGVIGDARRASPQKGAKLLSACAAALAEALCDPRTWTKQAPR